MIPVVFHGLENIRVIIITSLHYWVLSLFLGGTATYYAVLGRYVSSGITIRIVLTRVDVG